MFVSQLDTSFLTLSFVLITMGFVSTVFYLVFHRKSRAINNLPKDLQVKVFNKTFNVFDPYPEQRKIINNYIELLIPVVYGFFLFIFVAVLQILQMGFLLGFFAFIICMSLLMIDDASEFHKNASIFVNAVKNGYSLGKGDVDVLYLLKIALPKLKSYYLLLAIAFFASSLVVPYIVDALLLTFAQFAMGAFTFITALSFISHLAPFLVVMLFVIVITAIRFTTHRVKNRVFGFPYQEPISSVENQIERMKLFIETMQHNPTSRVPEPEKTKKAEEVHIEPDKANRE